MTSPDAPFDPSYSATQEAEEAIETQFMARKLAFSQTVPDYEEIAESVADLHIPAHIADFARRSEGGVAVLYYLAGHLKLLAKIVVLSPPGAIAALQEMEQLLGRLTQPPSDPNDMCWYLGPSTASLEQNHVAQHLARLQCMDVNGAVPN